MPAFLTKWWPAIALAGAMALVLTVAYCNGRSAGRNGEVVKQQSREIETQRDLNTAASNAADARITDAVKAAQQQQELSDAIQNSSSGDDARRRRGCAIMRQQGRDVSHIPACR